MYSFRSWGPPLASRACRLPRARSSMLCSSGVPGEVISVVQAYIVFYPQIELLTYICIHIYIYTYIHIYISHTHIGCFHLCIVHWSVMRRSRKTGRSQHKADHSTRPQESMLLSKGAKHYRWSSCMKNQRGINCVLSVLSVLCSAPSSRAAAFSAITDNGARATLTIHRAAAKV